MKSNEVRKYLWAFADGELNVERNLMVLEHMAMDPRATRRVMHQQQLRQAVSRCVCKAAPAAPPALRRRIEQLASTTPVIVDTRRVGRTHMPAFIRRWSPAIAAALFLGASLAVLHQARDAHQRSRVAWLQPARDPAGTAQEIISPAKLDQFARRHVECSRSLASLNHAAALPQDADLAPRAVGEFLGVEPATSLDLSKLGYEYAGLGQCFIPSDQAVHLLYRAQASTGRGDALSLWIARYEPQRGWPVFAADTLHTASRPNAPHPLVFWHHQGLIYFLVGDHFTGVDQAAGLLLAGDADRPAGGGGCNLSR